MKAMEKGFTLAFFSFSECLWDKFSSSSHTQAEEPYSCSSLVCRGALAFPFDF